MMGGGGSGAVSATASGTLSLATGCPLPSGVSYTHTLREYWPLAGGANGLDLPG
jgi:hypothetical protein